MKIITYDLERINKAMSFLNTIQVTGIEQARVLVAVSNILESGNIKEIVPERKVEKKISGKNKFPPGGKEGDEK